MLGKKTRRIFDKARNINGYGANVYFNRNTETIYSVNSMPNGRSSSVECIIVRTDEKGLVPEIRQGFLLDPKVMGRIFEQIREYRNGR